MSDLLNIYESMNKQAEADAEVNQRVDVLNKYASVATELLDEKYPNNYTQDDVVKLAEALIVRDIELEESMSKVAEYVEAGKIMARSFMEELSTNQTQ